MVAHWVESLSKSRIELATDAKKEKERKKDSGSYGEGMCNTISFRPQF